jgi:hypothetical protein
MKLIQNKNKETQPMLRKFSLFIGASALSIIALTIVGPKAAHALTAALVQIVNTPANPVNTLDASKAGGQMVQLFCAPGGAPPPIISNQYQCYKMNVATGIYNFNSLFPVPAGQNLVVTTVDVPDRQNNIGFSLSDLPGGGTQVIEREGYSIPAGSNTVQFQYPSAGMVFSSGSLVMASYNCFIYGYLTAN